MNKQDAIRTITECADEYQKYFAGRKHLYIYDKNGMTDYIEAIFHKSTYRHLTGVNTDLSANQFYNKCINHQLSSKDFEFRADGTTELKMRALPRLMRVNTGYKMIGEFDDCRPKLITEKVAGNQFCCMGFVSVKKNCYIPNTILQEDIRDITTDTYRVIAVYSKDISDNEYTDILYLAKGISKYDIDKFVKYIG